MYEDACYKKPFLKEVILRVDFATPVELFVKSLPQKVATAALQNFPLSEPQKAQNQEITFAASAIHTKTEEFTQWVYHGMNREKTLTIQPDVVTVQHRRYETYDKFSAEALNVFKPLFDSVKDLAISRVGLRYVNVIELPDGNPLDWDALINPQMLGVIKLFGASGALSRAFHVVEFNHDGQQLKLQYGIVNPDYPALIRRRHFALDIDSYFQGALSPNEVAGLIDAAHTKIQSTFEASITSEMRTLMASGQP